MSTQPQTTDSEVGECAHCGGPRPYQESVHGSYCSKSCYWESRGERYLNLLRDDHRYCSTCGRKLKSTVKPHASVFDHSGGGLYTQADGTVDYEWIGQVTTQDASIGQQYLNENATHHIDARRPESGGLPIEYERIGCACGTVNPRDRHGFLQTTPFEILYRYYTAFQFLWDDGIDKLPQEPVEDEFYRGYLEADSIQGAVGYAFTDGDT